MERNQTQKEYIHRVQKVQDYIEANIGSNLTLETLSDVSGFSKYHFHRIFRGIMKETLLGYINRVRIERAANCLFHNPSMSITEIALQFGYSDSAVFARSFKHYYGISASEARQEYSKNCKVESKDGKANITKTRYNKDISKTKGSDDDMLVSGRVEVRTIEEMNAIYLRHIGSYEELAKAFQGMISKLLNWAYGRNLIGSDGIKLFAIYHDHPEFTDAQNLKTSICLAVSEEADVSGEIGKMVIPSGKYAIGHFEIDQSEAVDAWNYMYGEWLPNSGLQPGEGYVFEMYMNDPNTHPEKKHFIDIYLPVKPL